MRRLAVVLAIAVLVSAPLGAECNFSDLRKKAEEMLRPADPSTQGSAEYRQVLTLRNGEEERLPKQKDFAFREIPFVLADTSDCTLELVRESRKVIKGKLTDFLGGHLRLADRAFGPIHNDFNTQTTTGQATKVAILNKWKLYSRQDYFLYTPYSKDLHRLFPELVEAGREHFRSDMVEAEKELLERGAFSQTEIEEFRPLIWILFQSESTDPYEFKVSSRAERFRLAEQPFVTLAANGNSAYTLKVSFAGAKGPLQIWYRSCDDLRKNFPMLGFSSTCNAGALGSHSHIENVAAAYAELKMHKGILIRLLGPSILEREDFSRMLEASYNGGPGWVVKAYRAYGDDWAKPHFAKVRKRSREGELKISTVRIGLRGETVDYLLKCDFLSSLEVERSLKIAEANAGAAR